MNNPRLSPLRVFHFMSTHPLFTFYPTESTVSETCNFEKNTLKKSLHSVFYKYHYLFDLIHAQPD